MFREQEILWEKIREFEIDDIESDFTFTDRLARENDWSTEYSVRAIHEYKRFVFMLSITKQPLTPSDEVDQVWHLHLLYTVSYWVEMCRGLIGKEIHHGPTKGGQSEKDKYKDFYQETKDFYKSLFNEDPPKDIWPSSEVRFGQLRFTRVNRHRNWVVPKLKLN
jgi:hypothetical protein